MKAALTPSAPPSSFSFTTMGVRVLVAVLMALLAVTSGTELKHTTVNLRKCCDVDMMLSADGESCVTADWSVNGSRNFSFEIDRYGFVFPPQDSEWVGQWLPPGLLMDDVDSITGVIEGYSVTPVNASSLWDPALLEKGLLNNTVAFLGGKFIARPKPGGGFREAEFCVDAAPPPLGPFAMRFKTWCNEEECAYTCCKNDELMSNNEGHWTCEEDDKGYWTPHKSALTAFDPEFPYKPSTMCENIHLLPFDEQYAEWARHTMGIHHFHFSTWITCFDFYRSGNDSLREGVFSCEYPRITRGVYWLLRPLCFLSTLLLTVSLTSVACDKSMRRKIHGRCLASHAACLLAFNIGQTVYYIAMSDRLDDEGKAEIPADLQTVCKNFALLMYFVLISAWIWLTALCVNMARGFRLDVSRLNKGSGKKFLVISAFAWGLSAVLTITSSILFTQPKWMKTPAWYSPSLMETRVCYIERLIGSPDPNLEVPFRKSGTTLFYYGPVCCLVVCNIVSIALTLKKVRYLKKGNSVLRREEDQIPLGQRHAEGNNRPTAHTATGSGRTRGSRGRSGTTVDAKAIKLYVKMVLLSGVVELFTEVIMWATTHENHAFYPVDLAMNYDRRDRDLAYRAAGYVTDFFRAAVVTWLAAPEGGYLHLIKGMLHRDRQKKSPGAGNAGRRKQNVA